ncbi:hypothetical protein SLA2020_161090 [Shorea laevis]
MPRSEIPKWVKEYIEQIKSVLRDGGWDETDISDIVNILASGFFGEEMVLLDHQTVLDVLLLKVDWFSKSLRKADWSCEKVSDTLGFDF